jgi:serine-type D-Ala-D-Ala carboxypeptidase/endopeptidase (penicillin-binding protein 4)
MNFITFKQRRILSLAFVFALASFAATAQTPPARERIAPTPTPTPKIQATPTPKTSPSATPTPFATPTPTPTPRTQTLAELQSQIRGVLSRPALTRAQVGVKIVALDADKIVFEQNAEKYFMPASNMKSFTIAAALDRLSPNFRFVTSVFALALPDASGTIRGDLMVYGRGNPLFSTNPQDGAAVSTLEELASKIAASGVRRIEGNLVGDDSYFAGDAIPPSWEWDDLQWYYGAEVSALSLNDNAVDLKIAPGGSAGAPCVVSILPANTVVAVVNTCQTTANGKREIQVTKRLGANIVEIGGTMPRGDNGYTGYVSVTRPAHFFVEILKNALALKGVVVAGQARAVDLKTRSGAPFDINALTEITRHESPPLSLVAARTMKPSQNLYTEMILRALGETTGDKTNPKQTSAERGALVVQKFLAEAGVSPNSVVQWDGSGLSRHNLITPSAAARLYAFMDKHRYSSSWRESLTVAGVDGTLQNRFKGTAAAMNVRGKTGTIDQVSALTAYVTTASGERLAFSIIVNNLPGGSAAQRAVIDDIVLALASFNGKTN